MAASSDAAGVGPRDATVRRAVTARQRAVRLPSLTGLRALAALGVFAFHLNPLLAHSPYRHLHPVFRQGFEGVYFFFALSGFVLAWTHDPRDPLTRYFRKRFARVAPNHLVTWAGALLLLAWLGVPVPLAVAIVTLFLMQAWFSDPRTFLGANNVSWSLSCEVFLYLCLPALLHPLARRRPRLFTLGIMLLALLVVDVVLGYLPFVHNNAELSWLLFISPPIQLIAFALGGIAARELLDRPVDLTRFFLPTFGWAVVAYMGWGGKTAWLNVLVDPRPAFAALIVVSASMDVHRRWTPFRNRPLVWLGERSFAFYLVHYLILLTIQHFYNRVPPNGTTATLFGVIWLAAAIVASALLFAVVERPAERRLRGAPPRPEVAHDDAEVAEKR